MDRIGRALMALLLLASAASARDLGEILEEKGVIDHDEAKEATKSEQRAASATTAAVASVPALPDWVSKVTFFGDVRVRNETFFRDGDEDRNRDRFRLRIGAKVKVNDETELGFKLVSGTADDPISNNVTESGDFSFKNINIGNAYVKVAPAASIGLDRPWVTLMGGKFDVPLYRIPGPAQPVMGQRPHAGRVLREPEAGRIQRRRGAWPVAESRAMDLSREREHRRGRGLRVPRRRESRARRRPVEPSRRRLQIPEGELDRFSQEPQHVAQRIEHGRAFGWDDRRRTPDRSDEVRSEEGWHQRADDGRERNVVPGKPIAIVGYVSDFNEVDVGTDLLVPTGMAKFPVRLFFDYVKNTEASGSDDQGFQGGATIGGAKDPGDLFFTYAYERLETDAVISAFSESDFGHDGGTNTKAHILQTGYVLLKGLSFLSTVYFDKPIRNVAGRSDKLDKRWQVDLIAKF